MLRFLARTSTPTDPLHKSDSEEPRKNPGERGDGAVPVAVRDATFQVANPTTSIARRLNSATFVKPAAEGVGHGHCVKTSRPLQKFLRCC